MTVKQKFPFDLKLLLELEVLKVEYEPYSESTWYVSYKGYDMELEDILYRTTVEDETLTKKIRAQICLGDTEILPTEKQKKAMITSHRRIIATGIYADVIETDSYGRIYMRYKLDSVFPLVIESVPKGAKIGDWITATGEARITLPRTLNQPDRDIEIKQM